MDIELIIIVAAVAALGYLVYQKYFRRKAPTSSRSGNY